MYVFMRKKTCAKVDYRDKNTKKITEQHYIQKQITYKYTHARLNSYEQKIIKGCFWNIQLDCRLICSIRLLFTVYPAAAVFVDSGFSSCSCVNSLAALFSDSISALPKCSVVYHLCIRLLEWTDAIRSFFNKKQTNHIESRNHTFSIYTDFSRLFNNNIIFVALAWLFLTLLEFVIIRVWK